MKSMPDKGSEHIKISEGHRNVFAAQTVLARKTSLRGVSAYGHQASSAASSLPKYFLDKDAPRGLFERLTIGRNSLEEVFRLRNSPQTHSGGLYLEIFDRTTYSAGKAK